jgi:P27 family predicted phage terminase small subunit
MPAAKPAALKLLNGRGNGKDAAGRTVNTGPGYVRGAPDPPEWLSDEARAEWRRVVPELERLRLLSRVTRSSLAGYCETWATFVAATRELQEHGGLTINAKQGTLAHPAVAIQRNTSAELRRWATEYGLTPASEQKVKAPDAEEEGAAEFS